MTCVATTDYTILEDAELGEHMNKGPNFRRTALEDTLNSTEIGVWSDHILNQLYPWINFIHNTFGIEKEPLVLAMKKVGTQIELDIRSATTPVTAEVVEKAPQDCNKFYLIDGKIHKAIMW